ncbi:class A beta-lactamase, subclass A2 [Mucilaginibacter sp.]|uniref:class A beta-lactamase, subclass A2 n=1 Tax=Mucilaginibacter sp. TaxID=1882438 RepID=UPI00261193CA|nr:class A beta-lactamase, subclass A2 [Mucilaginibacter sp.]MDB5031673.1 class beta-lactamase [Mucilaginibacter sp.]
MLKNCIASILLLFVIFTAKAQDQLKQQIAQIAKPAKGIVGVSVLGLEDRDTLTYNGNARMVMQSVMKFPIAIAVLHQVDMGKLKLEQTIHITKNDLPENYSPLRDKYPAGGVNVSISDLLGYMVSLSDNDACDILLKKLGGTKAVMDYLHKLGIKGIAVNASESEMAAGWEVQYTNWCKPNEIVNLIDMFYQGKTLNKNSTDFLMKIMTETSTGPKQIKGLLPVGTVVAHKTGKSGTNKAGLSPATNDVGIITLPNGKHLAIAVFVCNTTADLSTREEVIAKVAKAVYDNAVKK